VLNGCGAAQAVDFKPVPALGEKPFWSFYIDNFACAGSSEDKVNTLVDAGWTAFEEDGIKCHERTLATSDFSALGGHQSGPPLQSCTSQSRMIKLRSGVKYLL